MRLDPEYVPCRLKMAQLYHVVTEFEKSGACRYRAQPRSSESRSTFLEGLLMRMLLEIQHVRFNGFKRPLILRRLCGGY